jgi:hypothetical protein
MCEYSLWEELKGQPARDRSARILAEKGMLHPVKGVSAETADAIAAGKLEIVEHGPCPRR